MVEILTALTVIFGTLASLSLIFVIIFDVVHTTRAICIAISALMLLFIMLIKLCAFMHIRGWIY